MLFRSFNLEHITGFLMEKADVLAERWVRPVPERVLMHAHAGYEDFGNHAANLLATIPQLEVIDTVVESGYTCGVAGSGRAPEQHAADRGRLIDRARETGADAVVSLYHSCHRSLLGDAKELGVPVVNFTDLMVRALGDEPAPDGFARLSSLPTAEVAQETRQFLLANGIQLDQTWFDENYQDLLSMAEYRGGLACLA